MNPIVLLAIRVGVLILFGNYMHVCEENIHDDSWVKNAVPIYMGFAIITLFMTIYKYSDIKDEKIYKTFIIYIVLSMIFFYIPITNVCITDKKFKGLKTHADNIFVILSIGILIYLIAVASSFPMKISEGDANFLDILL